MSEQGVIGGKCGGVLGVAARLRRGLSLALPSPTDQVRVPQCCPARSSGEVGMVLAGVAVVRGGWGRGPARTAYNRQGAGQVYRAH
jgi:hypothetical protein